LDDETIITDRFELFKNAAEQRVWLAGLSILFQNMHLTVAVYRGRLFLVGETAGKPGRHPVKQVPG